MTTVIWDGNELVSDSRATEVVNGIKVYSDDVREKIINGDGFSINGEEVQVMGVSGSAAAAFEIIGLGASAGKRHTRLDIMSLSSSEVPARSALKTFSYNLLVVTAENVYIIESRPNVESFRVVKRLRSSVSMIGGSRSKLGDILHHCDNARTLVSYAAFMHDGTGGNYNVWSAHNGIQTNVPCMSGWKAVFKIFTGMVRISVQREYARKAQALTI